MDIRRATAMDERRCEQIERQKVIINRFLKFLDERDLLGEYNDWVTRETNGGS